MMNFGLLWINGRLTFGRIEHILTLSQHTQEKIVTKWIVILAIVILAPTFVVNVFSNGVNFVSTQGKALVSEMAKEATKTVQESSK